ncbi:MULTISPECIES: LuxR C-terminal-related transcriptional regulator [Lentzea]|uniref:LuxR C-terminal-related transcriptional regulator n=1 Tax=Lentzea kristufekii TaxID=3095430 RepID=A0ABU4TLR5_9PSEU|nr:MULTISPECIES: LuxR C-terminal-related transcriptional regulator [Lentzea]MDX8048811.1 LuxR C-terminal-related transcriptional regulator [Lentzea sp. BCCO 10_0798]
MFGHLGVAPELTAVYELLVTGGSRTTDEIGVAVPVLEEMRELGLVRHLPGDVWQAVAPDLAVEALIAAREEANRRARADIGPLMELYLRNRDEELADNAFVEVVSGVDAVRELWHALLRGARGEVCVLDQPPYVTPLGQHVALEDETRERDVQWRVVYDRSAVDIPGRVTEIIDLVAAGERARVTPTLPFKLAVIDTHAAVLPVVNGDIVDKVLLIRPSALLDVLRSTFELYWDKGIPFSPGGIYAAAADVDPNLLGLLAAGLTDESIARQLGLAPRTVQRRVRQLMDRCGAQTRFQAGVQAMRRGWL